MGYQTEQILIYGVKLNHWQAEKVENLLKEKFRMSHTDELYSFERLMENLKFIDRETHDYSHDVVLRGQDADSRATNTNGYDKDLSEFVFGVENWLAISTNRKKGPSDLMKELWNQHLTYYAHQVGVTDLPTFHLVTQTI